MVIFVALGVLTLYGSSTSVLLANKALNSEPFVFNVLNTPDADVPILFLEVALRNPNGTDIMDPDVVADGDITRVSRLHKIVIVALLLLFSLLPDHLDGLFGLLLLDLLSLNFLLDYVLLFLLIVGALSRVLVVSWICFFEDVGVYVYGSSFHCSSFDVAKRTRKVDSSWTKGQADITDPTLSWHFCQPNASLMKADVAHATKDNQVVVSVVSVCAYLTLGVLELAIPIFVFVGSFTDFNFMPVLFLPLLLHVLKVLLLLRVELKDEVKRVFGGKGHHRFLEAR